MGSSSRIQSGATEPIEIIVVDTANAPITGLSDVAVTIRRVSDDRFFDWTSNAFSVAPAQLTQTLSEVSAANDPGRYALNTTPHLAGFNTSAITNAVADDTYALTVDQTTLTNGANLPAVGEIKVGQFVDDVPEAQIQWQPTYEDQVPTEFRAKVWLRRGGLTVLSGLVQATLELRDRTGAAVGTFPTVMSFDAHGAASFTAAVTLTGNEPLSARLSVQDAAGTVESTVGLGVAN